MPYLIIKTSCNHKAVRIKHFLAEDYEDHDEEGDSASIEGLIEALADRQHAEVGNGESYFPKDVLSCVPWLPSQVYESIVDEVEVGLRHDPRFVRVAA